MQTTEITKEFNSSYEHPHCIVNGYRLWFREYISSPFNLSLVGIWIAWPDTPTWEARYYCSVCGTDYCREYVKGQVIPFGVPDTTILSSPSELVRAVADGMCRLAALVRDL